MDTLRHLNSLLQQYSDIISIIAGIISAISIISSIISHRDIFIMSYKKYKDIETNRKYISELERMINITVDMEIAVLSYFSVDSSSNKIAQSLLKYLKNIKNKQNRKIQKRDSNSKALSVVSLFAMNKSKNNMLASLSLISCLVTYYIIAYISDGSTIDLVSIGLLVLITLIAIDEYTLAYRVKNGSFGYNRDEAKEIITFILKSSKDDNNFNGPDGKKISIFDKEIAKSLEKEEGYNFGLNQFPA